MARPKIRRKKRPATVPGIPVYKPLRRPVQLQEDRLARPAVGVHRALSEAGIATGGGEWGFHAANSRRPKPIRHLMEYEDQARRELQLIELEGWIRDCVRVYDPSMDMSRQKRVIDRLPPRVRTRGRVLPTIRASASVSFGGHLFTVG